MALICHHKLVNDVTIASSLRSVVQLLLGHFTVFQSHAVSMICAKNCGTLSKFMEVTANHRDTVHCQCLCLCLKYYFSALNGRRKC